MWLNNLIVRINNTKLNSIIKKVNKSIGFACKVNDIW